LTRVSSAKRREKPGARMRLHGPLRHVVAGPNVPRWPMPIHFGPKFY
jgi:hypothetical protein